MNVLRWEPARLRHRNYIDAMAMIRTSVLREELDAPGRSPTARMGGFRPLVSHGSAGHNAVLVPEILARHRVAQHSMLALTNLSATDAFSLIIESNPELMAGVPLPG